jgi:hypothetical protein
VPAHGVCRPALRRYRARYPPAGRLSGCRDGEYPCALWHRGVVRQDVRRCDRADQAAVTAWSAGQQPGMLSRAAIVPCAMLARWWAGWAMRQRLLPMPPPRRRTLPTIERTMGRHQPECCSVSAHFRVSTDATHEIAERITPPRRCAKERRAHGLCLGTFGALTARDRRSILRRRCRSWGAEGKREDGARSRASLGARQSGDE